MRHAGRQAGRKCSSLQLASHTAVHSSSTSPPTPPVCTHRRSALPTPPPPERNGFGRPTPPPPLPPSPSSLKTYTLTAGPGHAASPAPHHAHWLLALWQTQSHSQLVPFMCSRQRVQAQGQVSDAARQQPRHAAQPPRGAAARCRLVTIRPLVLRHDAWRCGKRCTKSHLSNKHQQIYHSYVTIRPLALRHDACWCCVHMMRRGGGRQTWFAAVTSRLPGCDVRVLQHTTAENMGRWCTLRAAVQQ